MGAARPASRTPGTVPGLPHPYPHGRHTEAHMEPKDGGSSNIFDRPDVENPDVGPFIAYFDARVWLAERISRQESLPIDEADSRAEKDIRCICMNTPKKLTMLGFHKADPDAA